MLTPELVPSWPVWIREFSGDTKTSQHDHLYVAADHGGTFADGTRIYYDQSEGIELGEVDEDGVFHYNSPSNNIQGWVNKFVDFFDFDKRFPRLNDAASKMSKYTCIIEISFIKINQKIINIYFFFE